MMRTGYDAALVQALSLVNCGFPCFPCLNSKKPATSHGYKDAARDRDAIHALWRNHPGTLVGVPTGAISGIAVLDIDGRHGGDRWFASQRTKLPQTRTHRTRSGGLHFIFRHHSGLRCSAGRIGTGVDVRADGGYIIWWPAAGFPVLSQNPMAAWPEWLVLPLRPAPRDDLRRIVIPDDRALMRLVRLVAGARPGERNSLTFWGACRAGEMVSSGMLSAETAVSIIVEAAARAGLPVAEAQRTAISGIRAGGERNGG